MSLRRRHGHNEARGLTLVVSFLGVVAGEAAGEVLHEEAVGLSRNDQFAGGLLDGEVRSVLLELALRVGAGGGDLLLGCGEDALLLLLDAGLDALLVVGRVLLRLRAEGCDLLVQLAQAGFYAAQANVRLFGRGASL